MKEQEIKKLELALGFKREIVGIKFIFIQEEYENIPVRNGKKKYVLWPDSKSDEWRIAESKSGLFYLSGRT